MGDWSDVRRGRGVRTFLLNFLLWVLLSWMAWKIFCSLGTELKVAVTINNYSTGSGLLKSWNVGRWGGN